MVNSLTADKFPTMFRFHRQVFTVKNMRTDCTSSIIKTTAIAALFIIKWLTSHTHSFTSHIHSDKTNDLLADLLTNRSLKDKEATPVST